MSELSKILNAKQRGDNKRERKVGSKYQKAICFPRNPDKYNSSELGRMGVQTIIQMEREIGVYLENNSTYINGINFDRGSIYLTPENILIWVRRMNFKKSNDDYCYDFVNVSLISNKNPVEELAGKLEKFIEEIFPDVKKLVEEREKSELKIDLWR